MEAKETNGNDQSADRDREKVIAYLSYAQEDVRALSAMGAYFLQLTIAALDEEAAEETKASSH